MFQSLPNIIETKKNAEICVPLTHNLGGGGEGHDGKWSPLSSVLLWNPSLNNHWKIGGLSVPVVIELLIKRNLNFI